MNRKDILDALDEISDACIEKAAVPPKGAGMKVYWYSGVAAVLVVAILLGIFLPSPMSPASMGSPSIPTFVTNPTQNASPDKGDVEQNSPPNVGVPTWPNQPTTTTAQLPTAPAASRPTAATAPRFTTATVPQTTPGNTRPATIPTADSTIDPNHTEAPSTAPTMPDNNVTLSTCQAYVGPGVDHYNHPLYPAESKSVDASRWVAEHSDFLTQTMYRCLTGENKNAAFSPVNLYMMLAMLAETTGGESRAEILSALGIDSMDELRKAATTVWNSAYQNGKYPCLLANSLWLQKGGTYNDGVMQTLEDVYYANAYGADFRQHTAAEAVKNWINKQTAGTLLEQTSGLTFDPSTVMSLVSTVYYQSLWDVPFYESGNTQGTFHGTNRDVTCTFMNKRSNQAYYQGKDFSAMSLGLRDGHKMWLILPDEKLHPKNVLYSGDYIKLFTGGEVNVQDAQINLSLPKFDISCKQNLVEDLKQLGIKRVFDPGTADFSILTETNIFVNKAEQATRVTIDEKGVTAASYVVMGGAGSAAPPSLKVDFVLDRPFIFVITNSSNLPLFAGVVHNP